MERERVAIRTTPADNENIEAIANALPRTAFATLTDTIQAALAAAAVLARQGILMAVLAEANTARRAQ